MKSEIVFISKLHAALAVILLVLSSFEKHSRRKEVRQGVPIKAWGWAVPLKEGDFDRESKILFLEEWVTTALSIMLLFIKKTKV